MGKKSKQQPGSKRAAKEDEQPKESTESSQKVNSNAMTEPPELMTPKSSFLSMGQLVVIITLCIGVSYLSEYRKVMMEGVGSSACTEFLLEGAEAGVDGCTRVDLIMVTAKFYMGCLVAILVGATMFICWPYESLMLRFVAFLCTSPLVTTIMGIKFVQSICNPARLAAIGIMATTLLAISAFSLYKQPIIRRLPISLDLPSMTLVSLQVAHFYECYKLMLGNVGGFIKLDEGEAAVGLSTAANAILPFLCVDHATFVSILIFALFFMSNKSKRSLLFFIALLEFANNRFVLPKLSDSLVDPSYYQNLTLGSALFAFSAAFGSEISFWTESR